jgi:hypothetical protein
MRKQAAPGHRHAHGAVDKCFQFQFRRSVVPNDRDIIQRKLPRKHHTLRPQIIRCRRGRIIGNARLCGNVKLHFRRNMLRHRQHAQVRNDERVHAGFPCAPHKIGHAGDLLVGRHCIQCQINPAPSGMGKAHALRQLLHREIFRRAAHAEFRSAHIYRICAVQHGKFQPFQVAGRAQNFGPFHSITSKMQPHTGGAAASLILLPFLQDHGRIPWLSRSAVIASCSAFVLAKW